jgi:hypothetical protein
LLNLSIIVAIDSPAAFGGTIRESRVVKYFPLPKKGAIMGKVSRFLSGAFQCAGRRHFDYPDLLERLFTSSTPARQ